MQFEVPQFIDVEDKIFGPLTWKQFLYLGGGIGMAVVLLLTTNIVVFALIGIPIAIFALTLSFVRINNRPFSYLLEAMFNYTFNQRLYLWRKKENIVYRNRVANDKKQPAPYRPVTKDIASLSRKLEMEAIQKEQQ